MRKSNLFLLFPALIGASLISGCVVRSNCPPAAHAPTEQVWVHVATAPPALRAEVEVRPAQPSTTSIWIDGHYEWRGTWVWVDGFWDAPRAGYVWTAPVVVQVQGGYQYHPGYYRPARVQPPPVYTRPGTVRVSVRPAASATATGTVQVRAPEQPAQPSASVQVRGPTATVTPAAAATVTASGTARVSTPTATASGTARVNAPTATASGTARVNTPTATVRPATPTATASGTTQGPAAATVRPATATVTASGTARVNAPTASSMAQVSAPTASAGATVTGPTMTTVRPPTAAGGATVTPPSAMGTATTPTPSDAPPTSNLRCSINTPRAPAGGYITINGNGFGNDTTVSIGGNLAAIQSRRGSQLRVEVPAGSGGTVQVTANRRTATCGTLEIIGR